MDLLKHPWSIEFHSGIPAYKQIVNFLQTAIASGKLEPGDQLPTIRALHEKLGLNPNTVAKAYHELEINGFISTQRGSGCFVAPQQKVPALSAKEKAERVAELAERFAAEAQRSGIRISDIVRYLSRRGSHV
ncbi:MAG: GntR family transcriptional regulator [Polyangiaceae bacterium]